jgi:hypothetical protein
MTANVVLSVMISMFLVSLSLPFQRILTGIPGEADEPKCDDACNEAEGGKRKDKRM